MTHGSYRLLVVFSALVVLQLPTDEAYGQPADAQSDPPAAVEHLKEVLGKYPSHFWLASEDTQNRSTAADVLAAMKAVGDAQLQGAMQGATGEKLDLFLSEAIRRGGDPWRQFVARRWDAIQQQHADAAKDDELLSLVSPLHTVRWLTSIRRLEGKADPLRILVAGKRTWSCNLGYLPKFQVLLTNLDCQQTEVLFTSGGDYRSGRQTKWRFQVTDANGAVLPPLPRLSGIGGGLLEPGTLEYGESWTTQLDMNSYVQITVPGEYTCRILYHEFITIADRRDVTGLIMCTSLPITLTVKPVVTEITREEQRSVRQAIAELPTKGPVKLLGGVYSENMHDFIKPTSSAGRLLEMQWKGVSQLIDAALDREQNPTQRAWLLAILANLTNRNNPRDEPGVLGPYEFRDSGWSVWPGTPGAMSGGLGSSEGTSRGSSIDVRKQLEFAKRWREWKEMGYVRVTVVDKQ